MSSAGHTRIFHFFIGDFAPRQAMQLAIVLESFKKKE
jgi:hypothetical protein